METAIVAWEQHLLRSSKLSASTIAEYLQDVRRFAAWLACYEHFCNLQRYRNISQCVPYVIVIGNWFVL
jgi:hypothetical protein